MKVLERKELSVVGICPHCGSKLELEKGDIWWHKDIDGGSSPCVTCAACGKGLDIEGWKNISKQYTRTDAFIERALKFLDGCIPDYIELKHANVDTFMDVDNERFIKDFINYMKGE